MKILLTQLQKSIVLTILFFSCAPTQLVTNRVQDLSKINIIQRQGTYYNPDSSKSIPFQTYMMRQTLNFAAYDHDRQQLFMKYSPGKNDKNDKETALVFDLKNKKTLWAWHVSGREGWADDNTYVLLDSKKTSGFDPVTGNQLWEHPFPELVDVKNNIALVWAEDRGIQDSTSASLQIDDSSYVEETSTVRLIHAVDLKSGQKSWSKGILTANAAWTSQQDEHYFRIFNGLEYVNLKTGANWFIDRPTTAEKGKFKAMFINTLGILALSFGVVDRIYLRQPANLHSLSSFPLIEDDRVYFGAQKNILCVEKATGNVYWETELESKVSVIFLKSVGSRLLTIYTGWRYQDYRLVNAGNPSVFILDKATGKTLSSLELDSTLPIIDAFAGNATIYVITPNKVILFDTSLNLIKEIDSEDSEKFFSVIGFPNNNIILIRSTKRILALNKDDNELMWRTELPELKVEFNNNPWVAYNEGLSTQSVTVLDNLTITSYRSWEDVVKVKILNANYSDCFFTQNYFWIKNGKGFSCFDINNGSEVMEIILPPDPIKVTSPVPGLLEVQAKNSIMLIPIGEIEQ